MHVGRFSGLEEALAQRPKEKLPPTNRRSFLTALFATLGGVACGLGGGYALGRTDLEEIHDERAGGRRLVDSGAPWEEQVAWARGLAKGPRRNLLQHYSAFCTVAERSEPNTTIWLGLERLGHAVLSADTDATLIVADRVLQVFALWPCPDHLVTLHAKLRAKIR